MHKGLDFVWNVIINILFSVTTNVYLVYSVIVLWSKLQEGFSFFRCLFLDWIYGQSKHARNNNSKWPWNVSFLSDSITSLCTNIGLVKSEVRRREFLLFLILTIYYRKEVLKGYTNQDVTISLPDGLTLRDIKWFAVWCRAYEVSNIPLWILFI